MKEFLVREQMLFTELQNFAAFKSYRILKFGKLVGSLIKKDAKIEFSDVLRIFELLLHLESNLAEIWIKIPGHSLSFSEPIIAKE